MTKIARQAYCVLARRRSSPSTGFSSSIPKKILLPMDFSPSSYAALEMATDLARHFQAQMPFLLHAIPMLPPVTGAEFFSETEFLGRKRDRAEQRTAYNTLVSGTQGNPFVGKWELMWLAIS